MSEDVREKLRALIRLAEVDASARGIEDQLEGIPKELEERRMAMRALEALVGAQRTQMLDAEKLLGQQEEELRHRSDMLARSKAKGAKARTMREAEAAERELESIRRSMREAEAERERLSGVIGHTRETLSEPLAELDRQKAALDEAERGSEARLAELRAERDRTVAGRERFVAALEKPIYRRYERIRHKLQPTVCEAIDATCTGCRMRLPPQLFNRIQAALDFHQCPHCQRFLYFRDLVLD